MMKKKLILFLAAGLFFASVSFAQTHGDLSTFKKPVGNAQTTPNYDGDMMYYYQSHSQHITVPDSVIRQIKAYASANHVEEKLALKISTALRPLFNESFTVAERLDVVARLRSNDAWDKIIPQSFYDATVTRLQRP